jgi:hypothetical protein
MVAINFLIISIREHILCKQSFRATLCKRTKKFIKNLKNHICSFDHTPSIYINFQDQTFYSLAIPKREFSDIFVRLDLSEILSFLLLFRSYELYLEILYIDGV